MESCIPPVHSAHAAWNLAGSGRPGICPCLTPSMVPYVTNRGGPLIGLEALSLQGIPIDDLLLTRESDDQVRCDQANPPPSQWPPHLCLVLNFGLRISAALVQPPAPSPAAPRIELADGRPCRECNDDNSW